MPGMGIYAPEPILKVDTGPSRLLWKDCPWNDIDVSLRGTKLWDNFDHFQQAGTSATDGGLWRQFFDTSCTIAQSVDKELGEVALTTTATDNDDCIMQSGTGNVVFRDPQQGSQYSIWFESRFKISQVTSGSVFVGLMDGGSNAGAGVITTGDVIADKNCIGFAVLAANPTLLIFTYKKLGATVQVPIASLASTAMAADTYVSAGFHFLQSNPASRRITVFRNNVRQSTGVPYSSIYTSGAPVATFPMLSSASAVDSMAPTIGVTTSTTAVKVLTVDWIKSAMLEN